MRKQAIKKNEMQPKGIDKNNARFDIRSNYKSCQG